MTTIPNPTTPIEPQPTLERLAYSQSGMLAVDPQAFGIEFETYFARELEVLGELEADGLVTIAGGNRVELTFPLGRVLMRNVAAVFDAYLEPDAYRVGEGRYFSANA